MSRPESIGPFRITGLLGEGGMGIVYLAEQSAPIRRRVAIKVIKPGMDSREVLARFEAERQALAVMTHPNIARVFDAGTTDEGRPYFVMEYVPGIRITEYCDMQCLPLRQRLELFAKVCEAVQHAHQKGVLHRDLKASNVLVATEDGKPLPKVIDFGLAKAIAQPLTDESLLTARGVLIGTPEYMSPEQAGMTGQPVDARTDIYSLGVMLYEILVGALPFDAATLRRAAVVEMLRIIQEEEPPSLAARFSSLGANAADIARRRHTDIRSLGRELHGDLEWITMRALEKDPSRRYPSASEFAADVYRHLNDDPVVAGPPSASYRLRKFAMKHRAAVVASAVSLVALIAAFVVTVAMYVQSESARRHAESEAARNELEAAAIQAALLGDPIRYQSLSRKAMELHERALGNDPARLSMYAVNRLTLLELLKDGVLSAGAPYENPAMLRREATELVNSAIEKRDPQAVKAAALLADLLEPGDAAALARRALSSATAMSGSNDAETFESEEKLAMYLAADGTSSPADDAALEAVYRASLTRRERLLPPNARGTLQTRRDLAALLERKAGRLMQANRPGAEKAFRDALNELARAGETATPRAMKLRSDLAAILTLDGEYKEAEALLVDVIPALARDRGENNGAVQEARNRLAAVYAAQKMRADAERTRRELPPVFVKSYREAGTLSRNDSRIERLGGRSTPYAGRSIWLFGETTTSDGATPHRATVAFLDRRDLANGLPTLEEFVDASGHPADLLALTPEETAFNAAHAEPHCVEPCGARWELTPASIVRDEARDRVLFFYRRILIRESHQPEPAGASIAVWTPGEPAAARPYVARGREAPTFLFDPSEPAWGTAALVVGSDLYAWACETRDLGCQCRLARVPLAQALDRSAWRFYARDGRWSAEWRDARVILEGGIQSGELSVHWNPFLGKFLAVSSRVIDNRIQIRMSERVEGPWTDPIELDTLPSGPGWTWTGMGFAHPELSPDGGRTEYLSYRRNQGVRSELRLMEVRFGRDTTR